MLALAHRLQAPIESNIRDTDFTGKLATTVTDHLAVSVRVFIQQCGRVIPNVQSTLLCIGGESGYIMLCVYTDSVAAER